MNGEGEDMYASFVVILKSITITEASPTCALACEVVWLQLIAINTGALVYVSGGQAVMGAGAPLVTRVQVGAHTSVR